jgi:hypothetical protein
MLVSPVIGKIKILLIKTISFEFYGFFVAIDLAVLSTARSINNTYCKIFRWLLLSSRSRALPISAADKRQPIFRRIEDRLRLPRPSAA